MSVFVRADGQRDVWVLQMSLDNVVELFSVLIELHDALWFFSHPELVKFIRQITWTSSNWKGEFFFFFFLHCAELQHHREKRKLTVQLVEVLESRCSLHTVVEMGFQGATFQQAVGHLRQVNANYGIGISTVWQTGEWKFGWRVDMGSWSLQRNNSVTIRTSWFFVCAAKCLLPEFRVVGMGQHLTSLLCVVFTEKPAVETNVIPAEENWPH